MLIYNYRSRDQQQQATALVCRRRTKVSWEFIARILALARKRKSQKMCRICIYTIFIPTRTPFPLPYCVKAKKCAIIHEIRDRRRDSAPGTISVSLLESSTPLHFGLILLSLSICLLFRP